MSQSAFPPLTNITKAVGRGSILAGIADRLVYTAWMPPPLSPLFMAVLIGIVVLAFIAFVIAMMLFFARVSGWKELVEQYGSSLPVEGQRFRLKSIRMRKGINYSHVVNLTVGEHGLKLEICRNLIFMEHLPMLLPWDEMDIEFGKFLFWPMIVLRMHKAPDAPIRISRLLALKLKKAAGDRWPGAGT